MKNKFNCLMHISIITGLLFFAAATIHAQSALPKVTQLKIDAEKGDPKAQVELAMQFRLSDKDEMIKWLKRAIQRNYPPAQYELGKVLMQGYFSKATGSAQFIKGDPSAAYRLYSQAASYGYSPAQLALAQCYENGNGVRQNNSEAYRWYVIAMKDEANSSARIWGKTAIERLAKTMSANEVKSAQFRADSFTPLTP